MFMAFDNCSFREVKYAIFYAEFGITHNYDNFCSGVVKLFKDPVIARSYCLIPLCLFATAVFFKNRKDHPVRYTLAIAFLIQTHVIMMFVAFLLCVCLLIEVVLDYIHNKERIDLIKSGFALLLPVISVVLFGCQMLDLEKNSAFQIKQLGIRELLISVESKSYDIFKMLCGKKLGIICGYCIATGFSLDNLSIQSFTGKVDSACGSGRNNSLTDIILCNDL